MFESYENAGIFLFRSNPFKGELFPASMFCKTFPKTVPGSNYPSWEEITISDEEERQIEEECRRENFKILDEALRQAKALAIKHEVNSEDNVARLAIALFEKQASHEVFWKENKAREKFDEMFKHW